MASLFYSLVLTGCNLNPEEAISNAVTPYKEYKIIEKNVVETLEKTILETEARKNGLNLSETSAHVISFKKTGTYASGEIRIMGSLNQEGLLKIQKKTGKHRANDIVSYSCFFEYSYKTSKILWTNDFRN